MTSILRDTFFTSDSSTTTSPARSLPATPPNSLFYATSKFATGYTVVVAMAFASFCHVTTGTATAQFDRVYTGDGQTITGAIQQTDVRGIQLVRSGKPQTIPTTDIAKVLLEGDPSALTNGREAVVDGQFQQAVDELAKLQGETYKRPPIEAEADFYLAYAKGKLALAGNGSKDEAAQLTNAFVRKHPTSWHFIAAAELLGDLAVASGKPADAKRYYASVARAGSTDAKARSLYLVATADAAAGDHDAAIAGLDRILGVSADSTSLANIQLLAKIAKARSLAAGGDVDAAESIVNATIAEMDPKNVAVAARLFNTAGMIAQTKGDDQAALFHYLKTHLIYSGEPQTHAEALTALVSLWTKIGRADRSNETRVLLKQLYPGY